MNIGTAHLSKSCPDCGGALILSNLYVAKPLGSFSLAGAQSKFSVVEQVVLVCTSCHQSRTGRLVNVTMSDDGTTFLSGHFEEVR